MAAGDVAERGNHDGDGEAVSSGDAEKADARSVPWRILVGADGARAEKNQSERADEFGGEFLRSVVHAKNLPARRE